MARRPKAAKNKRVSTLSRLRISDLQIFLMLARSRTLAEAAQALAIDEPQVREALARLDEHFGTTLLAGDELSEHARRLLPQIVLIVGKATTLRVPDEATPLTIAAPSFISEGFVPMFAARSKQVVRSLRLPSALMKEFAEERIIDASVSVGIEGPVPRGWSSELVGEVQYGLFASPTRAASLGPAPSADHVLSVPFVMPLFVSRSGTVEDGDDRCPLRRSERLIGHEVETIALACLVAAQTDCLVYGPLLVAAPLVREGVLTEIQVPGFRQADSLFLASSSETVPANVYEVLVDTIRSTFARVRHASAVIAVGGSAERDAEARARLAM